jgi:hypothetical protein
MWELFEKIIKIQKKIEINFLKNFRIFHKVKIVNIKINLVISRRVNANASPDVPKPLHQWGGCASPLIQSFGCTGSARALRRTGSARALRRTGSARVLRRRGHFFVISFIFHFFWGGGVGGVNILYGWKMRPLARSLHITTTESAWEH